MSILNDYATAKIKLKTKVYIKYALLYNMEKSWTDEDNIIQIHNQQFGAWTIKISRKDVCDCLKIRLTDKELQEIIDMFQECIPITKTKTERLADPKNPEDLTAVEERYQDTSKSTDNLLEAIDSAKEIYEDKRNTTYVYIYDGVKDSTPIKPYLSLSRYSLPPQDYRKLLFINGSNFECTNEEIIISSI